MNQEFFKATRKKDLQYLEKMLEEGADINCVDKDGKTALLVAAEENSPEVVKWLLDHGADIDYFDPETRLIDKTAFLYAGAKGLNEILKILIPFNPDVGIVNCIFFSYESYR